MPGDTTMNMPIITDGSRLQLHELRERREQDEWYVGRLDTGDFVVLPEVGVQVVRLLGQGMPIGQVQRQVQDVDGEEIEVGNFAAALVELGFVTEVDGAEVATTPPRPATWPTLRPRHVRWVLHPAVAVGVFGLILAGLVATVARPTVIPTYTDLLWDSHGGLVLAGNALLGWTLIFLHEITHLITARAAGVPGWMSISTRLQSLAAQTDVSGIWSAPRRVRMTVYLSGLVFELAVAASGMLYLAIAEPSGWVERAVSVLVLLIIASFPAEALVFMRTDLYFVLQDLSRCPNLYAEGSAYVWHVVARLRGRRTADPTSELTPRERTAVRTYAALLLFGTIGCLTVFVTVALPISITLLGNAIRGLSDDTLLTVGDSVLLLVVLTVLQALWVRAWLRRHGPKVRAYLRRYRNGKAAAATRHGV